MAAEGAGIENEILAILVGDWWRGQLVGAADRLALLKWLFARGDGPSLVFVVDGTTEPSETVELADGGAIIDLRVRVSVPDTEPDGWTVERCSKAFDTLGSLWRDAISRDDAIFAALAFMKITRDDLARWCNDRGHQWPKFWCPIPRKLSLPQSRLVELHDEYLSSTAAPWSQRGFEVFGTLREPRVTRQQLRDFWKPRHSVGPGRKKNAPAEK